MAYIKHIWVNDSEPDLDATNLNEMEQGIYDGQQNAEWGHITGSLENQPEIPSIGGEAENNISFIHTPNNYYDSVEKTEDKKLNSTGTTLEDEEGFNTTDFIKVVSSNKYEFDAEGLTVGDIVWEYNADKEPIQSTALTSHYQQITMTANTKYVRLSVGTYYYMVDTPTITNKIVVDNETFTETLKVGTEVDDKSIVNLLKGKNLFDKDNAELLKLGLSSSGFSDTSQAITIYIPCTPGATYTISKRLSARFRVCSSETTPTVGAVIHNYQNVDGNTSYTITINQNSHYLCAFVYISTQDTLTPQQILDSIQIEKGSEATTYTPFIQNEAMVNGEKYTDTLNISSEVDNTKGLNVLYSKNLFDKKIGDIQNGLWYDASNNKITSNNGGWYVVIPIESNKSYTISRKNVNDNNGLHLAVGTTASTPTANASFVSFGDEYGANVKLVHINSGATAKYMIIYVMGVAPNLMTDTLKTLSLEEMQVEVGTIQTTYTPFITPSIVVNNETIYQAPVVLWENGSPTSTFAPQTITLNDNLSNYEYYEILFYNSSANTFSFSSGKVLSGTSPSYILYHSGIEAGAIGNIRVRPITSVSDTQIVFDKAYQKVYNSNAITENNALDIPYRILGYK